MNVLIACELSGTVRDAFRSRGHNAMSCDLEPTESPGPHYQEDIFKLLDSGYFWDLIILHPECTYMAVCGNRHYSSTKEREGAINWTLELWELAKRRSNRVALENPQSVIFPILREQGAFVQYIQPYEFGHPETKKTGLALHNLPSVTPTWDVSQIMETLPNKRKHRIHYASPSPTRGKERSMFYTGMADAFADQWGQLPPVILETAS